MEREMGRRFKRVGTHVYVHIHVDVWQKQQSFVKQLSFKLKKISKSKL